MAEKFKSLVPTVGTLITLIITIAGWAFVAGAKDEVVKRHSEEITDLRKVDGDLQRGQDVIKGDVRELSTDVKWIRQHLERQGRP